MTDGWEDGGVGFALEDAFLPADDGLTGAGLTDEGTDGDVAPGDATMFSAPGKPDGTSLPASAGLPLPALSGVIVLLQPDKGRSITQVIRINGSHRFNTFSRTFK